MVSDSAMEPAVKNKDGKTLVSDVTNNVGKTEKINTENSRSMESENSIEPSYSSDDLSSATDDDEEDDDPVVPNANSTMG